MAKETAIVWKKSIMDNSFKCTGCGRLAWDGAQFTDDMFIQKHGPVQGILCRKCRKVLALTMSTEMALMLGAQRRYDA